MQCAVYRNFAAHVIWGFLLNIRPEFPLVSAKLRKTKLKDGIKINANSETMKREIY